MDLDIRDIAGLKIQLLLRLNIGIYIYRAVSCKFVLCKQGESGTVYHTHNVLAEDVGNITPLEQCSTEWREECISHMSERMTSNLSMKTVLTQKKLFLENAAIPATRTVVTML